MSAPTLDVAVAVSVASRRLRPSNVTATSTSIVSSSQSMARPATSCCAGAPLTPSRPKPIETLRYRNITRSSSRLGSEPRENEIAEPAGSTLPIGSNSGVIVSAAWNVSLFGNGSPASIETWLSIPSPLAPRSSWMPSMIPNPPAVGDGAAPG